MINLYLKEETALVKTATIYGINGPVIYLKGNTGFCMSEMVYVGKQKLVGEVIALDKDLTTVQVYEETTGLYPGEEVITTGNPVSVTLAPGILNNIFDGIERPLERIAESAGAFITRGVSVDSLDRTKKWPTHITVKQGDYLHAGDIIAEVPETHAITHKCMVPPGIEGTVLVTVADGEYTIDDLLVRLQLPGIRSACHRTADHRHDVSNRQRRYCRNPGWIRNRKDHDPASDRQVGGCGYHHLYRLW